MNDIRARFEEIWPVPDGIRWESDYMKGNDYYAPDTEHGSSEEHWIKADEWSARLDTFTRCQETTADIERALAGMLFAFDDGVGREWSEDILDFARKLVTAKEYVK